MARRMLEGQGPANVPPRIAPADFELLERLLGEQQWIYAKTMPQNPHHYTLRRKWASDAEFVWTVEIIRRPGYRQKFGGRWYTQIDVGEYFYWTMGAPINSSDGSPCTILINRKVLPGKPSVDDPDIRLDDEQKGALKAKSDV